LGGAIENFLSAKGEGGVQQLFFSFFTSASFVFDETRSKKKRSESAGFWMKIDVRKLRRRNPA
jgi:hypothetical protein